MSPEQLRQFNDMKRQLEQIKNATDVSFVAELARRLGQGTVSISDGASTTGTDITVRDSAGTGTEVVANTYDGVLEMQDSRGNTYRIGYYN